MKCTPCVGAVLHREDKLLLGLRSAACRSYPGKWDVVGGHCEAGETVEQTLVRELEEEVGVTPLAWAALGVFHVPDSTGTGAIEYHLFAVQRWSGEPRNASAEHDRIEWFTFDELSTLDLAAADYIEIFAALR